MPLRKRSVRWLGRAVITVALVALVSVSSTAVAEPSGSLVAFGANDSGQLGLGGTNATASALRNVVALPGAVGPVTRAASGYQHSLVVTASGQLYAYGSNQYGQLGIVATSGSTFNSTPALVTPLPGQIGPVTEVAANAGHSLVVTASGQLYAFGNNASGQLGNSTGFGMTAAHPVPTLVTLPGQVGAVVQVAAGASYSLALTASGQLYGFGSNFYGELGTATSLGATTPSPVLAALPGAIGPVTQIAAGYRQSLAVTASGQLYTFGSDSQGQLGFPATGSPGSAYLPTQVALPGAIGGVTQVAGGTDHSLAVTASGQLFTFGSNSQGQLGKSPASAANLTPQLVALPGATGPVTQVAGGGSHSLAVTASGQLYAFGSGERGQLGREDELFLTDPHPVPELVAFAPGTTIGTVAKGGAAEQSLVIVSNLALAAGTLPPAQAGAAYQATLAASGGTAPFHWSVEGLPPGLTSDAATGTITGTPASAATASLNVTLSDYWGTTTARTYALTVTGKDGGDAPSDGTPVTPQLTSAKQAASKWRLGTKLPQLTSTLKALKRKSGLPIGTDIGFILDREARVTLTFRHSGIGRKVAGKCVAKTSGNARKPHCTRMLTDGALTLQGRKGNNHLHFEGPLTRAKKLKPGGYVLAINATDAGKSSATKTLHFTIANP